MAATSRTPASVLQEFCVHRGITPVYEINDDGSPTHKKKFICKVTCDDLTALGEGHSKKEAKHAAAEKMLQQIQTTNVPSPYEGKVKKDAVGPLSDFCAEYGIKAPEYLHTRAEGPPHATMFTFRCSVESFSVGAIRSTKQQAKQKAALRMLTKLKKMVDSRLKIELPEMSFDNRSQEDDFCKSKSLLSNCNFSECKKIHSGDLTHPLSNDFLNYQNLFEEDTEAHEDMTNLYSDSNLENSLEKLTTLLQKAELKYTLIPVPCSNPRWCSVILNIDCAPNLNIYETSNTYEKACHEVSKKALQFLRILRPPKVEKNEENVDVDFENLINSKKKS